MRIDLKRLLALALFIFALMVQSCFHEQIVTHELRVVDMVQHYQKGAVWDYFDTNNDNVDEMLATESIPEYGPLYVADQSGKVMSQLNFPHPIRTFTVLTDPRNKDAWLFISFNDGKAVYLSAHHYIWGRDTKRMDKSFEGVGRTDDASGSAQVIWNGVIYPEYLGDFDGDGKIEVICSALSGFSANPRGIIAYDFDTGKLKWYFRSPTSHSGFKIGDFNDDGDKELIFGNIALKNSTKVINGLDDSNGWVGVLNKHGELIFHEKVTDGYSEVIIDTADLGRDGHQDIYQIATTWGPMENRNSVSILGFDGRRLFTRKKIDLARTMEREQEGGAVHVANRDGDIQVVLIDKSSGLLSLNGDLELIPNKVKLFIRYLWAARDIDNDGNLEYLVQTEDDYFAVLDNSFRLKAKLKNPFPGDPLARIEVVNRGFGKTPLLSILVNRQCRYYEYQPISIWLLLLRSFQSFSAWIALGILLAFLAMYLLNRRLRHDFGKLLNSTDMGVLSCRKDGNIRYINPFFLDIISRGAGSESAPPYKNIRELSLLTGNFNSFVRARSREFSIQVNYRYAKADHELQMRYLRFGLFKPLFVILCSPIYTLPDDVEIKMQWADTARRLSHNVRRHISNVLLALDPLERNCDHSLTNIENFRIIKSELEQVSVFTHAFQRFSELQDYDLKLQDIIPSVEHCLSRLVVPAGVKIVKNWSLESVEAEIEPIRFEEALTNIFTNALDAMPGRGILHVSINKFPQHTSPKGHLTILLEIDDNGYGIPRQYMKEIFRPFFTTKQSGTGIGIPETAKIIDSMHGILDIQSEEGVGTTVSIWLKGE